MSRERANKIRPPQKKPRPETVLVLVSPTVLSGTKTGKRDSWDGLRGSLIVAGSCELAGKLVYNPI